jgi:hypothetical protein
MSVRKRKKSVMHMEIVGVDLPLVEVTRIVRGMARELGWEADWDGEKFQVRERGGDDHGNDYSDFDAVRGRRDRGQGGHLRGGE